MLYSVTLAIFFFSVASQIPAVSAQAPPSVAQSSSGSPCWVTNYDDASVFNAVSDGRNVYVFRTGGRVQALNAATGEVIWSSDLGGEPLAQPAPVKEGLAVLTSRSVAGGSSGRADLRLLSAQTGIPLWSTDVDAASSSLLFAGGDKLFFAGAGIQAYSSATGKRVWTVNLKSPFSTATITNQGAILVATSDGLLMEVSQTDGHVAVRRELGAVATAMFAFPDGPIVMGDSVGRIFAVDLDDRDVKWELRNGGRTSSVSGSGDWAVATSYDNFVYALTPGGAIRWKRRLSGRLTGAPGIGTMVLLVPAANEGTVYAIDPKKGKILDRIKVYDEGADSKITVAQVSGDRFVITSSGSVRLYEAGWCGLNQKKQP